MQAQPFIWETHGIHVGTGADHVKHGIDDLDAVVERAIELGFPSVTFVIHTPRLTRFRYASERATDVKFIRGDASYFDFAAPDAGPAGAFGGRIQIRCGVELEWLGTGLGLQWNRAKLFQAHGVDFVVSSVHFAPNGIPYDGSREETQRLIRRAGRGGAVLGRVFRRVHRDGGRELADDLRGRAPGSAQALRAAAGLSPGPRRADSETARRLFTLLEMIAERNLALDVNLSGLRKGVGHLPAPRDPAPRPRLGIPVALGTDTHALDDLGRDYAAGPRSGAGRRATATTSPSPADPREALRCAPGEEGSFRILNLGMEMLNHRFAREKRLEIPHLSFGGGLRTLQKDFPESSSLGSFHALRVRKEERSVTISDRMPAYEGGEIACLFSHHKDLPGTLAILLNTLASEEINVETAWLNSLQDGTATAYLTLGGPRERHPRGGGVRPGHRGGPVPAHRAGGAHAPASAEARRRLPPGGGRRVASHSRLPSHARRRPRQQARASSSCFSPPLPPAG